MAQVSDALFPGLPLQQISPSWQSVTTVQGPPAAERAPDDLHAKGPTERVTPIASDATSRPAREFRRYTVSVYRHFKPLRGRERDGGRNGQTRAASVRSVSPS